MEVIVTNGAISAEEKNTYVAYIVAKYPRLRIRRLILTLNDDTVHFSIEPQQSVLTKMGGALISDPLTWNDAKQAEYFDTVTHTL